MVRLLTLGVACFLLLSCKTSFRISVQEPAFVALPNDVETLGIINSVNQENSPEQQIAGAILGTTQINGNLRATDRAIEGTLRSFDESQLLSGKNLPHVENIYNLDGSVNWTLLDSIAKKDNIDGFIELSKMETRTPVGGSILASATGQNGYQLDGSMYVNLYIAENHTTFEQFRVNHTYYIPTSGTLSIINILNDVQRKAQYFEALGFQLGHKAAGLFYPNWVWAGRRYYTKGSKNIKRAKPMIAKGNWDIAEEQLLMEKSPKNEKVNRRVLYNLALVKEGQGNILDAIDYAKQSALLGDKMANEYLRILERRKNQLGL